LHAISVGFDGQKCWIITYVNLQPQKVTNGLFSLPKIELAPRAIYFVEMINLLLKLVFFLTFFLLSQGMVWDETR